jgi:hypothetical protein
MAASVFTNPTSAAINSFVLASVLGMLADTALTFTFGTLTLSGSVSTDSNGNAITKLKIPVLPLGTYVFSVTDGTSTATSDFTIIEEDSQQEGDNIELLEQYTSDELALILSGGNVKPASLEGNFTTWSLLWATQLSATTSSNKVLKFGVNETSDTLFIDSTAGPTPDLTTRIYTLSTGAEITRWNILSYAYCLPASSILGKYYVSLSIVGSGNNTPQTLKIYKDGVLQQSILLSNLGYSNISEVVISPDGKYIILVDDNTGMTTSTLVVLKGS